MAPKKPQVNPTPKLDPGFDIKTRPKPRTLPANLDPGFSREVNPTPKVDPTKLSTKEIYSGEQGRQKAVADLTALRRELKTETAAGAKAAQSDPRFIAAKQALDTAKSSVGMRTSAEDLAALNKYATSDVATKDMTPSQRREERINLNQPSQKYAESLYSRPEVPPTWTVKETTRPKDDVVKKALDNGWDILDTEYGWKWNPDVKQWGAVAIAPKYVGPLPSKGAKDYATKTWFAGKINLNEYINADRGASKEDIEIAQFIPDITYSEYNKVLYALGYFLRDGGFQINVDDFLSKYEELYGNK